MELQDKIWELHAEGLSNGKIAQKLKVKKAVIAEIIGEAKNNGLGDKIEAFTEATGIKAVVESLTDDCGCKARKEALNKLFPNRKLNDLLDDDYKVLQEWFSIHRTSVSPAWQTKLLGVYNRLFNAKRVASNCSPCIASMTSELKKVYDEASNKQ